MKKVAFCLVLVLTGCASQDIPQAHRGKLFARTGLFALYRGGNGMTGRVLDPSTQFLGLYNELRLVDCSMTNVSQELDTLTHDGVHFGFQLDVRFAADCTDPGVERILASVRANEHDVITPAALYTTFIRPAIGEAAREQVSPYKANELNERQAEISTGIKKRFVDLMSTREKNIVVVHEVNVSNLHYPTAMDSANLERAVQSVLRDKAIAERERVSAEIETTTMRRELAEREADNTAVRIDRVGKALARNPEYLQYELVLKLPDIYREAGQHGNLILAAPQLQGLPLALPSLAAPHKK
jgi:hypothetical protein